MSFASIRNSGFFLERSWFLASVRSCVILKRQRKISRRRHHFACHWNGSTFSGLGQTAKCHVSVLIESEKRIVIASCIRTTGGLRIRNGYVSTRNGSPSIVIFSGDGSGDFDLDDSLVDSETDGEDPDIGSGLESSSVDKNSPSSTAGLLDPSQPLPPCSPPHPPPPPPVSPDVVVYRWFMTAA
ncbi:hypothetical protein OUZ56_030973 [Daphnia magna]|uniref:Uncharacterized protein n=1 Tax=Daphnia magna TaxID=35525 RepID=A0ABQ9ZSU6_9CRUS|nr:hypothetical protein OUZ56_030973 [Daphnia magna]